MVAWMAKTDGMEAMVAAVRDGTVDHSVRHGGSSDEGTRQKQRAAMVRWQYEGVVDADI